MQRYRDGMLLVPPKERLHFSAVRAESCRVFEITCQYGSGFAGEKNGIIERENCNKPKSEESRQPGCPEEKVKAIEEALLFFQMI